MTAPETLAWIGGIDGHLRLIDQTKLPLQLAYLNCHTVETAWKAIKDLSVRGAPAIGIAAAYGVCLGLQQCYPATSPAALHARLDEVVAYLKTSRPTAINLFWALDRIHAVAHAQSPKFSVGQIREKILREALKLHQEDRQICREIGRHGQSLLEDGQAVLTHCNAGGLAASEFGTALALFFAAQDHGKNVHVFVDETRPLLQGARLTSWELTQHGIPCTLICDSMAGQVMKEGRISAVVTGADRIAANGDTANKIGTYSLAVLAHQHEIPFFVAAPTSTFDASLANGNDIPIEQRAASEVTHGFGRQTAPEGVDVYNPAFDVTPAKFIRAIITEVGLIDPVTTQEISRVIELTG